MPQEIKLRFVNVRGAIYYRSNDIANYIRELAASEEIDVRHRLNEAAAKLDRTDKDSPI